MRFYLAQSLSLCSLVNGVLRPTRYTSFISLTPAFRVKAVDGLLAAGILRTMDDVGVVGESGTVIAVLWDSLVEREGGLLRPGAVILQHGSKDIR